MRNALNLFGIDVEYITQIQKKEILRLVQIGFSYESLSMMPIAERRLFFKMHVDDLEKQKNVANEPLKASEKEKWKNITESERAMFEKRK